MVVRRSRYSLSSDVERLQQLGVSAVLSVDAARPPLFELEMADVSHECPLYPLLAACLRPLLADSLDSGVVVAVRNPQCAVALRFGCITSNGQIHLSPLGRWLCEATCRETWMQSAISLRQRPKKRPAMACNRGYYSLARAVTPAATPLLAHTLSNDTVGPCRRRWST